MFDEKKKLELWIMRLMLHLLIRGDFAAVERLMKLIEK